VQHVLEFVCGSGKIVQPVSRSIRLQIVNVAEECVENFACGWAIASDFAQLLDCGKYRICVH
jgi:hypothetical protein